MNQDYNDKTLVNVKTIRLENSNSRKKNKWLVAAVILVVLVVLLLLLKVFILDNNANKDKNNYYILGNEIDLKDNNVTDYVMDYYVVEKDGKKALMDKDGNLKTDYLYNYIYKEKNVIIASLESGNVIYDKNANIIFENVNMAESQYCYDNYISISKDNENYLLDKNGKPVLKNYDQIICSKDNFVLIKDNKKSIVDKNNKTILENVEINYTEGLDSPEPIYDVNDNFAILKESGKYVVYYFKTHKKSKKYDYVTHNNNYVGVTDNNKVLIKNNKGRTIYKYNKAYKNYQIVQKNMLFVPNDKCSSEEPYDLFGDLYNKDKKITSKGCNQIFFDEEKVYVKDKNNVHSIYYEGNKVLEIKGTKDSSIYDNGYGNYYFYKDNKTQLINKDGKLVNKYCGNITQITKSLSICNPVNGINYIYKNNKKLSNQIYYFTFTLENYITPQNIDGKYELYDKRGNKILDGDYDAIKIYGDSLFVLTQDGKTIYRKIKKVSKEEYNKYINSIKKSKRNNSKKIDYNTINTKDIINKYDLSPMKKLINDNEELFKKISYHTINNNNMTDSDKKYLLGMFDIIVNYAKYNDIQKLLDGIDELKVEVYDSKPSDMSSFAVGQYYDDTTRVSILRSHYDYALRHEFMHFISFHANNKVKEIGSYTCSKGIYTYDEILKLNTKEQLKCTYNGYGYSNGLEEAGAEYFTRVVSKNEVYQSYYYTNVAYNLLQYILEDDFEEVEYSYAKSAKLYKLLNSKVKYDNDKSVQLINALNNVNSIEQELYTNKDEITYYYYSMADQLIKLYNSKNIGNWKDNKYVEASINILIRNQSKYNLDRYLRNNEGVTIENYNELVSLNADDYIDNIVKDVDANWYYYSWNVTRDNDKFIILIEDNSSDGSYEIKVYYDKHGNVIDKKINKSLDAVG